VNQRKNGSVGLAGTSREIERAVANERLISRRHLSPEADLSFCAYCADLYVLNLTRLRTKDEILARALFDELLNVDLCFFDSVHCFHPEGLSIRQSQEYIKFLFHKRLADWDNFNRSNYRAIKPQFIIGRFLKLLRASLLLPRVTSKVFARPSAIRSKYLAEVNFPCLPTARQAVHKDSFTGLGFRVGVLRSFYKAATPRKSARLALALRWLDLDLWQGGSVAWHFSLRTFRRPEPNAAT
jgi:hypothetical protein